MTTTLSPDGRSLSDEPGDPHGPVGWNLLYSRAATNQGVRIVSKRMGNIPARQVNAQHARTPRSSHPATFCCKS